MRTMFVRHDITRPASRILRTLLAVKMHKFTAGAGWMESNQNIVDWHEDVCIVILAKLENL